MLSAWEDDGGQSNGCFSLPLIDNSLFRQCFRIAKEAGVPIVVENVKNAQRWIGPAAWHYGSFYLWGDVPALMPFGTHRKGSAVYGGHGTWFGESHGKKFDWRQQNPRDGLSVTAAQRLRQENGNKGFCKRFEDTPMARMSSRSDLRKAASAQIAKIPFALAQHIARVFKP
jgi:hypothetical protein